MEMTYHWKWHQYNRVCIYAHHGNQYKNQWSHSLSWSEDYGDCRRLVQLKLHSLVLALPPDLISSHLISSANISKVACWCWKKNKTLVCVHSKWYVRYIKTARGDLNVHWQSFHWVSHSYCLFSHFSMWHFSCNLSSSHSTGQMCRNETVLPLVSEMPSNTTVAESPSTHPCCRGCRVTVALCSEFCFNMSVEQICEIPSVCMITELH